MRSLLDINVIISLLDGNHIFHDKAHTWWEVHKVHGWASCPLSENGVVRIMAGNAYPRQKRFIAAEVIDKIQNFTAVSDHQFWADNISLSDSHVFESYSILSGMHVTDIYLLALATRNQGRLVTFDQNIPLSPVRAAKPENLLVL